MAEHAARSMKSTRADADRVRATSPEATRAPLPAGQSRSLPPALASEMSQRFGQDFSSVRMHADAQAQRSAEDEQARAYTIGEHIVWGRHAPPPDSREGKHTLAHELAHVVQQRRGGPPPVQAPNAAHEVGADRAAAAVVSGAGAVSVSGATGVGVARQPIDPRHARGYAGEQGMGFEQYPHSEGWVFVEGPSGAAGHNATAPGFDGVAYKPASNELHIVDNKSFKRTGNVYSATAITKNLGKNLNDLIAKVEAMPKKGFPHKAKVLSLLKQSRDALAAGKRLPSRVKLTVTGTGGNSTGVSERLQKLGVEFRDITRPPSGTATGGGTKGVTPPTPKAQAKAGAAKGVAAKTSGAKTSTAKSKSSAAKGTAAKTPTAKQATTSSASKAGTAKGTAPPPKSTGKTPGKQATTAKRAAAKPTTVKPGASAKRGTATSASKTIAPASKASSKSSAAPKKTTRNATPKPAAKASAAKTAAPGSTAKSAPPKPGASKGGGPKSTIKVTQSKTGANAKTGQAKRAAASSSAPKSRPGTAKASAAKSSKTKASPPRGKASRSLPAKPTASKAAMPKTLPPTPPKATPAPNVTKAPTPPPATAKPPMPEPVAPRPGVARPGVPEPGMPAPKGGGPSVGGAAMSVALPIVAGVIHNKAVEKRIDKQSDEQGFVPHNAPSGEGRLYDLGAWLLDPTREAERNVDPEKRFKISPWRKKVRNLANFTMPGSTFDFTWEDPYCGQDLFGNPEVKYRYQKVTYRKGFDGRLTVESGDATGTLDLNDVINEAIPDEEIDSRIPRGTCGDGEGGLA